MSDRETSRSTCERTLSNILAGMNATIQAGWHDALPGPNWIGKTRVIEARPRFCSVTRTLSVKIDCAEFQHSHEIAKLIVLLQDTSAPRTSPM